MGAASVHAMGDEERRQRRDAQQTFALALLAAVAISFAYWWLVLRPDGFLDFGLAAQFAGTADRLGARVDEIAGFLSYGQGQRAVVYVLLFDVLWGVTATLLLWRYWSKAWKAGIGTRIDGKPLGLIFGAGAAAIGLVEKLLTLALLEEVGGSTRYVETWADVGPKTVLVLAWFKWVLAAILILLVVSMLVSSATAFMRRELPTAWRELSDELPPIPDPDDPEPPYGIGVCCSGGGLRAAGFALGALAKLEEEPPVQDPRQGSDPESDEETIEIPLAPGKLGVLGRARYLASVSGGGYSAAAWRIAAGTGELPDGPIAGNPLDPTLDGNPDEPDDEPRIRPYPDPELPALDLVQHVRERQRYLANGRGGLLRSALTTIVLTAFHFTLVLLFVFVLAWPIGRVVVSWAVTGAGRSLSGLPTELANDVGLHRWLPPLVAAIIAALAAAGRLLQERTPARTHVDSVIKGMLGMAAALSLVLLAVPWALDQFLRILPGGSQAQLAVAGIWGAALTALWQLAKERLKPVARYLGGVGLAIGLIIFSLWVMANAASQDAALSSFWRWLGATIALAVAFIFLNPDRWSLHGLYRRSLAGTFAATSPPDGGPGFVPHREEPPISEYAMAEGPSPIICCAAAREDRRQTGIQAVSMTFEPECITVYRWKGSGHNAELVPERITHAQFQRRLPRNRHGHHLHTLMGAAAISGAAVAPSLGRMNLWSTNALLAAFNARLGVWVPNPAQQSYTRSTTPRLVNMFKEMTQTYDSIDPNVYATDGGHWENLGLVELIRRRCATIFSIDTSGDPPGTYATLKEAIKLAKLECGATVELTDESWNDLAVDDDQIAMTNYGRGTVTYADGETADLLYIKAAIMRSSPLHIQRYAASDRRFPNYSTVDQLLTSEELSYLLHLGYVSTGAALEANRDLVRDAFASLTASTPPASALTSA